MLNGHETILADNRCRFQGVYHPYINQCICAPGFYGSECQFSKSIQRIRMISPWQSSLSACPTGYYGQSCSFYCSGNADDLCRGLLICLPDPYGCSCYSGWYGTRCNLSKPTFDFLIVTLLTLQVVPSIVMVRIVPINVPVTTVIDLQVSVIVMELNVIKVQTYLLTCSSNPKN